VLSETYGIITYQEDVMQIARSLAGYSLGEADLLRRAMGKKIKAEMDEHSARFTSGAVERGVPADIAAAIFDQCAKFAGYGFNKGHAAAYAQISYQTAFLRCYYPIEFYAACMTVDYNRIDRLATYHRELKEAGMTVLPPDVNASQAMFSIEEGPQGRAIRYGLAALKGVGTSVAQRIVDERRSRGPFTDALNFFSRCADIVGSRSVAEQLVKAGALDRLNASRGALLANVVDMMRLGSAIHRDRVSQQERLFGDAEEPVVFKAKEPAGRTRLDDLRNEVSSIGFYMSGHPLDDLMPFLKGRVVPIKEALSPRGSSRSLAIAGVVQAVRVRRSQKSGNRYAFVNVSDPSGEVDLLVFSEALEKANGLLEVGAHVMARVSAEVVDGDVRLSAFAIEDLSGAMRAIDTIEIALDNVAGNEFDGRLNALESELAMRSNGRCRILLRLALTEQPGHVVIKLPGTFDIDAKFMLDAPSKWGPCLPVSSGAPLS
jgi:DNA polymerase-3 subunit alpha